RRGVFVSVGLLVAVAAVWLATPAAEPVSAPAPLMPPPESEVATPAPSPSIAPATTVSVSKPADPEQTKAPGPGSRALQLAGLAREAYLGWFEAIHRDDPQLLATAVGSQEMFDAGVVAMEQDRIRFTRAPAAYDALLVVDRVLLDRSDCVVLEVTDDLTRFVAAVEPSRTVIVVYWPDVATGRLLMATQWEPGTPASVWAMDCDLMIRGIAG
ncbi:MAG: hypothetical protein ACE5GC_05115, partial [Acidimicrobiia bacterium]